MFFLSDKNKDNTTINLIVRFKGERYKFSTGEKVLSKFWSHTKNRCKETRVYKDGNDINLRLDKWEAHVKKVLNDFRLQFKIPSQEEFKQALKSEINPKKETPVYFSDFAKHYKDHCTKSGGTKKVYQTTINWIELYEKKHGNLKFSDINPDFYKRFHKFIFQSGVNSPNFFGTLIKNIKVFMNVSQEDGLHSFSGHRLSSFKKPDIDVDNIYLSVDELTRIHRLVIDEPFIKSQFKDIKINNVRQKVHALNLARGRFLIGAFTALRVSDFSRIEKIDDYVRIRTEKTGEAVVIPVHWIIKELLQGGFDLSEKMADQKLNVQIKEVCKYAGIKEPVTLTRFEKGKRIEVIKDKYEWVTTHTARRSGATNMYKAGIPTISIMKITGHKTEKSFLKYIKVTQEENAEILSQHPFFRKS